MVAEMVQTQHVPAQVRKLHNSAKTNNYLITSNNNTMYLNSPNYIDRLEQSMARFSVLSVGLSCRAEDQPEAARPMGAVRHVLRDLKRTSHVTSALRFVRVSTSSTCTCIPSARTPALVDCPACSSDPSLAMAFIAAAGLGCSAPATALICHRPVLPSRGLPLRLLGRPVAPLRMAADSEAFSTAAVPPSAIPRPVGVGIIGCGRIGQVHARAVTALPGATLVVVADPFEPFGLAVASEFSTQWVSDWKELVGNPDVDAVVIGSPTPFHAEQIKACVAAGKAVFCEKPISNDLVTIDDVIQAVDAAGVQLLVGFQRRFDSNFAKVKALVAAGAIGDVRTFTIKSRDPSPPPAAYLQKSGGIFLDMASHDFDMARFVCGAEIESVFVTGAAVEDAAREAGDLDTVIIVVKMSNGVIGTIENSRRCSFGYDQRIEVFGGRGSVVGNNKSADAVEVHTADGAGVRGLPYSFFMDRYADAYDGIMGAFVRMVASGEETPVSGADGRAPIVAAKAAALSHQEGRLVRLDEVDVLKRAAGTR